jgi:hypothetical protein
VPLLLRAKGKVQEEELDSCRGVGERGPEWRETGDAIAFREGELWLVQANHTKKESLINSVAMGDLMAASQTYSRPLSYSLHLLAVTNGNFAGDTKNEAARDGIRLLDRHKLMTELRTNPITLGAVYAREDDRCSSFADGVRAANRWFE